MILQFLQPANRRLPLHLASEKCSADVVKYLLQLDDTFFNHCDMAGNSILHYACRGGNCGVVKLLLGMNVASVSEPNLDKKLPIHLLVETDADGVDRESPDYMEAIWLLLRAYPAAMLNW